ncbi:MAG: hypothetical protein ACO1N5_01395 [Noviherbaspirillum sp.]
MSSFNGKSLPFAPSSGLAGRLACFSNMVDRLRTGIQSTAIPLPDEGAMLKLGADTLGKKLS